MPGGLGGNFGGWTGRGRTGEVEKGSMATGGTGNGGRGSEELGRGGGMFSASSPDGEPR